MIHMSAGLPYWQSIILLTIGIRTIMIPITVKSMVNAAKLHKIK